LMNMLHRILSHAKVRDGNRFQKVRKLESWKVGRFSPLKKLGILYNVILNQVQNDKFLAF
jgi:hypothetical protein